MSRNHKVSYRFLVVLLLTSWICTTQTIKNTPAIASAAERAVTPESMSFEQVGHLGGAATNVVVQGQYAYLAIGAELAVMDISDPTDMRRVGYVLFSDEIADVAIKDNYAYAVGIGIYVVDVSNPAHPNAVDVVLKGEAFCRVKISGAYLYAVRCKSYYDPSPLVVMKISEPANPIIFDRQSLTDNLPGGSGDNPDEAAQDLEVVDDFAYEAIGFCNKSGCFGYLDIYDIQNPDEPLYVGTFHEDVRFTELNIVGSYAYLSSNRGLFTVDLTNPSEPIQAGLCSTCANGIPYPADGHSYLVGSQVIEITAPLSPTIVTACSECGDYGVIDNTVAFFPMGFDGLRAVNIADVSQLSGLGVYRTFDPSTFAIQGHHAFVLSGSTMLVVDVRNPKNPAVIGIPFGLPHGGYKIALTADYAYITDGFGLVIVNISDLAHPYQASSIEVEGASGFELAGNYAYVAGSNGLSILNISNPFQPILVSTFPAGGSAKDVALAGSNVLLVDSNPPQFENLWVISVADPYHPAIGGFCWYCGGEQIEVMGNYAYVTPGTIQVKVIDISNLNQPVLATTHNFPEAIADIDVECDYGYFAGMNGGGLTVYDLADPLHPVEIARQNLSLWMMEVSLNNGLIYTLHAAPDRGLSIYQPLVSAEFTPAEGGTLTYTGERCLRTRLQIAPSTFITDTVVTYAPLVDFSTLVNGMAFTDHAFDVQVAQNGIPQPELTFNLPVTVTIEYDDADVWSVRDANQLSLFYWDGSAWGLPMLASSLDRWSTFTGQITRVGKYALFGPTNNLYFPVIQGNNE